MGLKDIPQFPFPAQFSKENSTDAKEVLQHITVISLSNF
jgi:hypothetical protein